MYENERDSIKETIGDLEQIRLSLGLSRRKICQLLLVDPSSWTRWTQSDAPTYIYRSLSWLLALMEKEGKTLDLLTLVNQKRVHTDLDTTELNHLKQKLQNSEINFKLQQDHIEKLNQSLFSIQDKMIHFQEQNKSNSLLNNESKQFGDIIRENKNRLQELEKKLEKKTEAYSKSTNIDPTEPLLINQQRGLSKKYLLLSFTVGIILTLVIQLVL